MTPALRVKRIQTERMVAASITGVTGDAGIGKGTGATPTDADTKGSGDWNIWD